MKLLSGLFRAIKKRQMTHDNDMGTFRDKLNELVAQKDTLSDDEIGTKVDELKALINDLPESEEKAKLDRFLEDFKAVKEQDAKVAEEAASSVADLFEKLDTNAMADAPEAEAVDEDVPEEKEEEKAEVTEEVTAEPAPVEEEKKDEATDEDPNPQYTLEEIYQFIKKRLHEEKEAKEENVTDEEEKTIEEDGDCEESTEDECAEEEKKAVTDCAPTIPVTMNKKAATGGLAEMFAAIKNGGVR